MYGGGYAWARGHGSQCILYARYRNLCPKSRSVGLLLHENTPYRELAPAGNIYERWTATPGVTGEPLDNVTLTLKFEAMGAQVCWCFLLFM